MASYLYLTMLVALSACGGGQDATPASSPPPPPPIVPAPPPPQTVSSIQFTVDNSITVSQVLMSAGGQLVLDVPGGANFKLKIPRGAFFAPSTAVSMQSIVDTQGLPPGLIPIAAVSLGPSGANFAVQPTIEIVRFEETRRAFAITDRTLTLDESEVGSSVIWKLATQVQVLNERCAAGNANAPQLIIDRISLLLDLESADLLSQTTVTSIVPLDFCASMDISPTN